jgi:hypothetical protein
MRKYLIAAAVAGGVLLFGGAPAYADENPAPANPLGGLLDPAGGLSIENPLGDSPAIRVKPGTNTPALPGLPPAAPPAVVPGAAAPEELPAARTGLGGAKPELPAADVVGGRNPLPRDFAVGNLPMADVLSGGGLPVIGGLLPNGRAADDRATTEKSGLLGDGVPLLGGLGGLLPEEPARTLPADPDEPDMSGMPAGGTAVDTPASTDPATDPADPAVAAAPDAAGPGDDDQRLHEEPIDNEAAGGRTFSDGRPVAGADPDYK